MTSFEPPSGADDLAAQAAAIERERAQMEAERAELIRARTQRDLDRQRAELDRERADLVSQRQLDDEPAQPSAVAVIDPSGQEFEVGADGQVLLDDDGQPVPKWAHEVIEFKGFTVQVRAARPEALQAFGMAVSKYAPPKVRTDMWALFVRNHISARSYAELVELMMDPDTKFTVADFGELTKQIATLGTARPTTPSQT